MKEKMKETAKKQLLAVLNRSLAAAKGNLNKNLVAVDLLDVDRVKSFLKIYESELETIQHDFIYQGVNSRDNVRGGTAKMEITKKVFGNELVPKFIIGCLGGAGAATVGEMSPATYFAASANNSVVPCWTPLVRIVAFILGGKR